MLQTGVEEGVGGVTGIGGGDLWISKNEQKHTQRHLDFLLNRVEILFVLK